MLQTARCLRAVGDDRFVRLAQPIVRWIDHHDIGLADDARGRGTSSENLIDRLPRKAISSVPKLASWTPFAFVVDSFLMRAADYGVRHRDR